MSAFKQIPIDKTELHASGSQRKQIVARIWRGQTKVSVADEYQRYLYENGVLKIEHMAGNLGVLMYQTQKDGIADFTVMSFWPDRQSISSWSGEDLTRTRHLERDPEYLLALPDRVELVDVIANDWQLPRPV
jgi:heme-degrading monooxygenase HmoA